MAIENYLDIDFNTFIEKQKEILKNSDTFKDYNYEGSNISVLLELLAYQMELNTYYQNQIAKNLFIDTANLYNTVHRLANLIGYNAKGYYAAYTDLAIAIIAGYHSEGDQLYIPKYSIFKTESGLEFVNTKDYTITMPSSGSYSFSIGLKEGVHTNLEYIGGDLVDYEIYLPNRKYDHDNNQTNNENSIRLYVNDTEWTRVNNFYESYSELSNEENVYTLSYDKNQNYIVTFSPTRNYPRTVDNISIDLIETNGVDGSVGANQITVIESQYISNITTGTDIPLDNISITNSTASTNAADPETVTDIKENSRANINTQFRCVTKNDYKSFLEVRNDVNAAYAWGEKEINPDGNIQEYNQIYISVIPNEWGSSTITTSTSAWEPVAGTTVDILIPSDYSFSYRESLSEYLEPRKMFNLFENWTVPDLIYFYFEIGIKIKRNYNLNNVIRDIKNKIIYYFSTTNRSFNESIDFRAIQNFVLDMSNISTTDNFINTAGVQYFVFRDISLTGTVYDYLSSGYPQYEAEEYGSYIDNVLRPIKLGQKQFPAITENGITIYNEG